MGRTFQRNSRQAKTFADCRSEISGISFYWQNKYDKSLNRYSIRIQLWLFFLKFQKQIALRQTEQPIRIFGTSYSACYNHENQADRQLCHTFSKPCSEVKWFIWNILPQLRLKLLLHTFQCIAMQWLCIIFYHSVLLQIQEKRNWDYKPLCIQNCRAPLLLLCLWLRNEHGTGEHERQRCLSPVCL